MHLVRRGTERLARGFTRTHESEVKWPAWAPSRPPWSWALRNGRAGCGGWWQGRQVDALPRERAPVRAVEPKKVPGSYSEGSLCRSPVDLPGLTCVFEQSVHDGIGSELGDQPCEGRKGPESNGPGPAEAKSASALPKSGVVVAGRSRDDEDESSTGNDSGKFSYTVAVVAEEVPNVMGDGCEARSASCCMLELPDLLNDSPEFLVLLSKNRNRETLKQTLIG